MVDKFTHNVLDRGGLVTTTATVLKKLNIDPVSKRWIVVDIFITLHS